MRPPRVLSAALAHVLRRYHEEGADYRAFVNDQLKSIRQDLVVQCIRWGRAGEQGSACVPATCLMCPLQ